MNIGDWFSAGFKPWPGTPPFNPSASLPGVPMAAGIDPMLMMQLLPHLFGGGAQRGQALTSLLRPFPTTNKNRKLGVRTIWDQ